MTTMLFASHGTQDMYPTFLQRAWHFSAHRRAAITALSGCGAIIGGIVVGHLSDKVGRRRAMTVAFLVALAVIPLWAFASNEPLLVIGAILMQFMVQGAWGVVPAHLAELSPNSVRAFLPGFAYQCAGVLASGVVYLEAAYAQRSNYSSAMALTAGTVFVLAAIMACLGREKRGAPLDA
jgi:SHS family lactate transporter-like MFS transporter